MVEEETVKGAEKVRAGPTCRYGLPMSRIFTGFLPALLPVISVWAQPAADFPKEIAVVTYNVENLFDVDRVSKFDDYAEIPDDPNSYGPTKLLEKLRGIGKVLQSVQGGRGPEILLLNELEIDFTPESKVDNYEEFLTKHAGTTAEKMLTTELTDELRGLPAEAWLVKHLEDIGLKGYRPAVGKEYADPAGRGDIAHKNVVLSRLPILEHQTHETAAARGVLEAKIDAEGQPLTVLVNHWKSKASDPAAENQRLGNAKTVRERLDALLRENPMAEVIVAGDLNSHYNQGQRYGYMTKTAVQDVLGSQGNKEAMGKADGPVLYNLWYEKPPEERFSDEFSGEWGTLMQMLVTRGLLDGKGIEYVDGSFGQVFVEGVNRQPPLGLPWRWTNYGTGGGTSDHFPVAARFRRADPAGSRILGPAPGGSTTPGDALKVGFDRVNRAKVRNAAVLKGAGPEAMAQAMGEIFLVEGTLSKVRPLEVEVDGQPYLLHSFDKNLRDSVRLMPKGKKFTFLGEFGLHKGKLQFVIQDPSWIK
jgi:endonuclease/exonuclease/phosphatase family metal-dependent hydrolase